MATATFTNPYGEKDATGKIKANTSYTKRVNPYESAVNPYGADYQKAIEASGQADTTSALTSPEAVEQARVRKANMAGLGILGGTAYDVEQGQATENVLRQGALDTAKRVAEAKQKGSEYDANMAFQKALFGSEEAGKEADYNTNAFLKAMEYENQLPTMKQQYRAGEQQYETNEAGKTEKATQMATATSLNYNNDYEMSLAPKSEVSERLKASNAQIGAIINTDTLGVGVIDDPNGTITFNGKVFKRFDSRNNLLKRVS
jgi:hypothetical protein